MELGLSKRVKFDYSKDKIQFISPTLTTLKKSEYSFQSLKLLNFDNLLEAVREVSLGDDPYIFAAW